MPRCSVELVVANAFEYDLVEVDTRDHEPGHRSARGHRLHGPRYTTRHVLTECSNGCGASLFFPLPTRQTGTQAAADVFHARVGNERHADDAKTRRHRTHDPI